MCSKNVVGKVNHDVTDDIEGTLTPFHLDSGGT